MEKMMSKTTHNTEPHNTDTPRDLTEAELDLTVGGWLFFMYYRPTDTLYITSNGGCSPNMQPHCQGYR